MTEESPETLHENVKAINDELTIKRTEFGLSTWDERGTSHGIGGIDLGPREIAASLERDAAQQNEVPDGGSFYDRLLPLCLSARFLVHPFEQTNFNMLQMPQFIGAQNYINLLCMMRSS